MKIKWYNMDKLLKWKIDGNFLITNAKDIDMGLFDPEDAITEVTLKAEDFLRKLHKEFELRGIDENITTRYVAKDVYEIVLINRMVVDNITYNHTIAVIYITEDNINEICYNIAYSIRRILLKYVDGATVLGKTCPVDGLPCVNRKSTCYTCKLFNQNLCDMSEETKELYRR